MSCRDLVGNEMGQVLFNGTHTFFGTTPPSRPRDGFSRKYSRDLAVDPTLGRKLVKVPRDKDFVPSLGRKLKKKAFETKILSHLWGEN